MAVAAALARLHGVRVATPDLAKAIGRGARSGIGIGAFDSGGFLVDGGLAPGDEPAPVIARLAFPPEWRVLLILDPAREGLHGSGETAAFGKLPDFAETLGRPALPRAAAAAACRGWPSTTLPRCHRRWARYSSASAIISAWRRTGVTAVPTWPRRWPGCTAQGILGIGQSSWGPTGFALFDSAAHADAVVKALGARFGAPRKLEFRVVGGRNRGADITVLAGE